MSSKMAEMTPRTKLLPVLFVKTLSPCFCSSSLTIFVVVVLPLVPDITTTPWGSFDSSWLMKDGLIRSMTRPGNAEPLPPRSLVTFRMPLPSRILNFSMFFAVCLVVVLNLFLRTSRWRYGRKYRLQVEKRGCRKL